MITLNVTNALYIVAIVFGGGLLKLTVSSVLNKRKEQKIKADIERNEAHDKRRSDAIQLLRDGELKGFSKSCPKCQQWFRPVTLKDMSIDLPYWWYCECRGHNCGYKWIMIASDEHLIDDRIAQRKNDFLCREDQICKEDQKGPPKTKNWLRFYLNTNNLPSAVWIYSDVNDLTIGSCATAQKTEYGYLYSFCNIPSECESVKVKWHSGEGGVTSLSVNTNQSVFMTIS